MRDLTLNQVAIGVFKIFANAKSLLQDAYLLKQNNRISSAYALAYICCEKAGKISILVGAATNLAHGSEVKWKSTSKRFLSHNSKASQFFALARTIPSILKAAADGETVIDFEQLRIKALLGVMMGPTLFANRSAALYCDEKDGTFSVPADHISLEMLNEMLDLAEQNIAGAELMCGDSSDDFAARMMQMAKDGKSKTTYDHIETSKSLVEFLLSPESRAVIKEAFTEASKKSNHKD